MSAPGVESTDGLTQAARGTHVIVLPSWVGDAVMATPALAMLRERIGVARPGERVVLAGRGGMDDLLAGVEVEGRAIADVCVKYAAGGMLAPLVNSRAIREAGAMSCLLLPGSFSGALAARMSGAAVRVGYASDSRASLLTHAVPVPREPVGGTVKKKWLGGAPIGACDWYWNLVMCYLRALGINFDGASSRGEQDFARMPADVRLRLAVTPVQQQAADEMLAGAGVRSDEAYMLIVPGANRADKRWPTGRFAFVAKEVHRRFGLRSVVSGSPAERDVCDELCKLAGRSALPLTRAGGGSTGIGGAASAPAHEPSTSCGPMGRLKGVVARSRLMLVGDTGPRHIAAALNVPIVALFGPTDPRWTPIPAPAGEARVLSADEVGAGGTTTGVGGGLPSGGVTDDHPARYRIDLIQAGRVVAAVERMLAD